MKCSVFRIEIKVKQEWKNSGLILRDEKFSAIGAKNMNVIYYTCS